MVGSVCRTLTDRADAASPAEAAAATTSAAAEPSSIASSEMAAAICLSVQGARMSKQPLYNSIIGIRLTRS